MTNLARTISVISDLHLGGDPGFRMMTHVEPLAGFIKSLAARDPRRDKQELVINGDFVDFLAERHGDGLAEPMHWKPFIEDPVQAAECFETIASREDGKVFDALARLLEAGHRLTILPGNHDVELCLPAVREALLRRLGVRPEHDLVFQHDGEAYVLGDAVIEHGNRYDETNFIDHEQLHRLRVQQSLRQSSPGNLPFAPPFGSRFVAEVMNEIKVRHSFVDLLKPEGPALVALLLAIDPGLKQKVSTLVGMIRRHWTAQQQSNQRMQKHEVFRGATRSIPSQDEELAALFADIVGGEAVTDVAQEPGGAGAVREVMRGTGGRAWAGDLANSGGWEVIRLVTGGRRIQEVKRHELLRAAVRKMGASPEFARDAEEESSPFLKAARDLSRSDLHPAGFRFVVFGHTHHAKDIALGHGARYLNSGTWANLMSFPAALFDRSTGEDEAKRVLGQFVEDLQSGNFEPYLRFEPTYVRLRMGEDGNIHSAAVELVGAPSME